MDFLNADPCGFGSGSRSATLISSYIFSIIFGTSTCILDLGGKIDAVTKKKLKLILKNFIFFTLLIGITFDSTFVSAVNDLLL